MIKNILKIFSNKKIQICIILLVVCIIGLVVLKDSSNSKNENSSDLSSAIEIDGYVNQMEDRIVNIVESVSGVSNVKCLVYTTTSIEIEYATDVSESGGENHSDFQKNSALVFEKDGSKNIPVIIKKNYPKIVGILVVAKGVDDEKTKLSIINALASVFDINISSIEVLSGD